MDSNRTVILASLIVIGFGVLWGFYWLPLRQIDALGFTGPWGTVAIMVVGAICLAPWGWRRRKVLFASHPMAIASLILGGCSLMFYSLGLLYGRVAIIVILFYLTPVWSTIIGRYLLGWPITRSRVAALLAGIVGLVLILGADGEVPVPRGLGEWLGLASGFAWAVASIGIKVKSAAGPAESTFLFAVGALVGGLILAPMLAPIPDFERLADPFAIVSWVVFTGVLWWVVSIIGLLWATTKLEPARVGILLMSEVVVSVLSAAMIAGEHLSGVELIGGALVLIAGVLEFLPDASRLSARRGARHQ
ncbi:EamA-like transporter family protein [Yoonia maricola]|uniref:EamA-like transporter family protein n=1 Tax=Yoonia maricola TaxID=420999 RepID=A0A2M8WM69_9RHOB|nr:DMT family transporter [Yoonia maricola]PJI92021.1 EamA-like transporter family protein [Yoonia maricola]